MIQRAVRAIACMAAVLVAVLPATATAPASATVSTATCNYSPSTHTMSVSVPADNFAGIARGGKVIEMNGDSCLSPLFVAATVENTDLIKVTGAAGPQFVTVSMGGGRFRPGFTDESGSSDEIEFRVALGGGNTDSLSLGGTGANDRIRFGAVSDVPRVL